MLEFFVNNSFLKSRAAMFICTCLWLTCLSFAAQAASGSKLKLQTNQAYIERLSLPDKTPLGPVEAVFARIFAKLPDRVKVYPTENYYYFRFSHNGVNYAGNFRLDNADRDKGVIYFVYFPMTTDWRYDQKAHFKIFTTKDGVSVEKLRALVYRVSFKNKSVIFALNDLTHVKPPKGFMRPHEIYIGPIFDESAIQFFLLYNTKLKIFHYILNETARVPDVLYASKISSRIVIGRRTGFAYYRDKYLPRKILIGVYGRNSDVNNYLDGPFDQLPDNFLKGDHLKNAIIDIAPELRGKIDRFGVFKAHPAERFLIQPYLYYSDVNELGVFKRCARKAGANKQKYYRCFAIKDDPGR